MGKADQKYQQDYMQYLSYRDKSLKDKGIPDKAFDLYKLTIISKTIHFYDEILRDHWKLTHQYEYWVDTFDGYDWYLGYSYFDDKLSLSLTIKKDNMTMDKVKLIQAKAGLRIRLFYHLPKFIMFCEDWVQV